MRYLLIGMILWWHVLPLTSPCQEAPAASFTDKIANFPSGFCRKVNDQATSLDQRITRQTEKYLQRLARQEARLRQKMYAADSAAAKRFFANNPIDYTALLQQLHSQEGRVGSVAGGSGPAFSGNTACSMPAVGGTTYIPYLDSIKTSLKYLQQRPGLVANGSSYASQIHASLSSVTQLQNKIQVTEQIQQLLRQRRDQIKGALSHYTHLPAGLQKSYQGYSQKTYYYAAQLKEYRQELSSDPDKLTKRALGLLKQTPGFQSFMKTHSDLASLFSLPGSGGAGNAKALAGLQTRDVVQQQLHGQVASSGSPDAAQAINQQIQSAKTKLKALQDKVTQAGGGSSSMDIPDFRPNTQKTKSLWGRLEGGINIQSLPSTTSFPTTTDFGASLGYKLNDRNIIAVGASFKMGWGRDIRHISITSQGVGLRSSFQTRIKGSFSAYGGFEYNYQQIIYSVSQLRNLNYWSKSGLIGVSKQYRINSKLKGNLQLLWDFLSYQQVPRTQAVLFRVGYIF